MKRYRPLVFFGIAVVLGLVTSILVFSWLQNEKNRLMAAPIPLTQNVQVVVANADFAWGTKLTPEMVQIQEFPSGAIPEGHFTSVDAIKDRVVMVDVKRNEVLLESKLAPVGATTGGVAAVTDVNKRAMSVKVDDVIGVAGFIKPADRCRRHGHHRAGERQAGKHDGQDDSGKRQSPGGRHADGAKRQGRRAEAGSSDYRRSGCRGSRKTGPGVNQGRLRLALRNPLNTEHVLTKGAKVGALLSSYRPKQAVKPAHDGRWQHTHRSDQG